MKRKASAAPKTAPAAKRKTGAATKAPTKASTASKVVPEATNSIAADPAPTSDTAVSAESEVPVKIPSSDPSQEK